jgi:hypothetical protein
MSKKHFTGKIFIALLVGVSSAFLFVALSFIAEQSNAVFRSLQLLYFGIESAIVLAFFFSLTYWFVGVPTKLKMVAGIVLLIVSVIFWHYVGESPLIDWFLPPGRSLGQ